MSKREPASSPSLSVDVVPDNSYILGGRRDTSLSILSDNVSLANVPSGFWDIRFQGSCPVCHHWHYKMKLKLSRHPGIYNGIRCENCGHKWFGLGGNSTHTSLVSQQTIPIYATTRAIPHNGLRSFQDGPCIASLVEMNAMSALGSPTFTFAIPRIIHDREENPTDNEQPEPHQPRQQESLTQVPERGFTEHTLSPDLNPARTRAAGDSDQARQSIFIEHSTSMCGLPGIEAEALENSGRSNLLGRGKSRMKKIIKFLGSMKRTNKHGSTRNPPSTTLSAIPSQALDESFQGQPPQGLVAMDQSVVGTAHEQGNLPAPLPSSTAAHESLSEHQLEPDNDDTYQKPVADANWRGSGGETDDPERLNALRYQKTLTAQQKPCSCAPNCICKRPSSSMAPNASAIDERPSLYPLDLAMPSSLDSSSNRPQRLSLDLAGIGGAFLADNVAGEPRLSVLSFSSSGSARSYSHSRGGSYGRNILRQDNSAFTPAGASMAAHEHHSAAVMAPASYAASSDGDASPRRNRFFFAGRDSLLLRPRAESSSVPHVPSPLASPLFPAGDGDAGLDRRRSDYTVSSLDTVDARRLSDRGGADGGISISPIQESASVSRVPSLEGYHGGEGVEVMVSPLVDGDADGGRRERGPLDSHPVV